MRVLLCGSVYRVLDHRQPLGAFDDQATGAPNRTGRRIVLTPDDTGSLQQAAGVGGTDVVSSWLCVSAIPRHPWPGLPEEVLSVRYGMDWPSVGSKTSVPFAS